MKVLYVRNLTASVTEDKLREVFEVHGKVERVKKIKDYAFVHFEERKMERGLIEKYFDTVDMLLRDLNTDNHALAVEIAGLPMTIRGYGHVKHENVQEAHDKLEELLAQWPAGLARNMAA